MNHSHFAALGSMNSIKPERSEEHVAEGRNISLTCKYEGTIYNIQWYRQYQRSRPEFLLYITEAGVIHPTESDFSAHIDKTEKRVDLEIISAAVTDSAVDRKHQHSVQKPLEERQHNTAQHPPEGCKGVDTVTQPAGDVRATEGGTVTLGCKFQTSTTAFCSGTNKKSMVTQRGGDNAVEFKKDRFDATLNNLSAAVTDSAVYYCALKPTVTGNTTTLYKNLWSKDNTILHNIHQREPLSTATKGEAVTLGCHYNTTSTNDYLFWYKQHGDNSPTFILSRFKIGTGKTEDEDRFSSTLDSSLRSVPLKIQKLQLSDSAVYYCALQPTVTGNTNTLYKNLWSKDNTILHNIHQREPLSVRV
ncbi:hypothetical protein F7725_010823 [Dissostichus mawsoni]|uniref:Ig-like domain-containing protein n=1 Tax=Dissostichus mawsoni TaxID=36200 RepID=A0A7J5Z736_DISMA|nr:hypothetical protein F7725_010823 [Dissostichus mawsoni]